METCTICFFSFKHCNRVIFYWENNSSLNIYEGVSAHSVIYYTECETIITVHILALNPYTEHVKYHARKLISCITCYVADISSPHPPNM